MICTQLYFKAGQLQSHESIITVSYIRSSSSRYIPPTSPPLPERRHHRHSYPKPPTTFLYLTNQRSSHQRQHPATYPTPSARAVQASVNIRHASLNRNPPTSRVEQPLPRQYVSPLFLLAVGNPACKQGGPFWVGHDSQDSNTSVSKHATYTSLSKSVLTNLPSLELTAAIPNGLPFGFAGYFSVGSRVPLSTYRIATLPLSTNCCADEDAVLKLALPSLCATGIGNALLCMPCRKTLGAVSESVILTMHTLASYCSEIFVSKVGQPSVPGMMLWRRVRN